MATTGKLIVLAGRNPCSPIDPLDFSSFLAYTLLIENYLQQGTFFFCSYLCNSKEARMANSSSSFGISALRQVFSDSSTNTRTKVIGIYTFLIAFNILVWILALVCFAPYPALLGTA